MRADGSIALTLWLAGPGARQRKRDAAEACGISTRDLASFWELGGATPTQEQAKALERLTGIPAGIWR